MLAGSGKGLAAWEAIWNTGGKMLKLVVVLVLLKTLCLNSNWIVRWKLIMSLVARTCMLETLLWTTIILLCLNKIFIEILKRIKLDYMNTWIKVSSVKLCVARTHKGRNFLCHFFFTKEVIKWHKQPKFWEALKRC